MFAIIVITLGDLIAGIVLVVVLFAAGIGLAIDEAHKWWNRRKGKQNGPGPLRPA